MENKRKHLEFIQLTITRMTVNSFFIKGWTITLIAALFALSAKDANAHYLVIAFFPIPVFWLLDGFFLWQERLFRALYDKVRIVDEHKIDYSMNTSHFVGGRNTWTRSVFSMTLNIFYGFLIFILILVIKFIS